MSRRVILPLAAVLAATGLAACGPSGTATQTSSQTATSSAGGQTSASGTTGSSTVRGTGFSLGLPAGFQQASPPASPASSVRVSDGTRTLDVVVQPAGVLSSRQVARNAVAKAKAAGGTATLGSETTLAGVPAVPVDSSATAAGVRTQVRELFTRHGATSYVVVLSSTSATSSTQLVEQFKPVLDAWTWTD